MNREQLLAELMLAFRETSTEGVLLHQAIADMLGLNITDYKCLGFIIRYGPISAGKLAQLTGLTTGAITGVVNRLEKAGYARRMSAPHDRRQVIVETPEKEQLEKKLEQLFRPLALRMEELASTYSDEELALILAFLKSTLQISHEEMLELRGKNIVSMMEQL